MFLSKYFTDSSVCRSLRLAYPLCSRELSTLMLDTLPYISLKGAVCNNFGDLLTEMEYNTSNYVFSAI